MLNKLINAGILAHHSPTEIKRIRLLNQMVLIFSGALSFKLLNEIIALDIIGSTIALCLTSMYVIVWLLNSRGRYRFARVMFLFINAVILALLCLMFGKGMGTEFLLFTYIIVIVLYYDLLWEKLLWVGIFVLSYLAVRIYLSQHPPLLVENLSASSFYYMLSSNLAIVFILFNSFVSENNKFRRESIQLLEELKSKNNELENANQELEKFAFVASHDLKTPLRNINSFLQLIDRRITQGKLDELPEYLEFAQLYARRMHNLIEDILEFSRVDNKEKVFENISLTLVVQKSLENLQDTINEKDAIVETEQLPTLLGNEGQLILLFQNLIENSLKYNQSTIPKVRISTIEHPKEYEILVEDNGIGIEKEYYEKVFNMFYRLHNQENYEGTGIGLATSRKIVVYHGGTISVAPSSDKGTIFKIIFPKHSQDIHASLKTK